MKKIIIFDLGGTLVKMRPAKQLISTSKLATISQSFHLAIVTGAKRAETINILTKLGIISLFSLIITKDDTDLRKPNPRLIIAVESRLKSRVVLFVGDSPNDAKMAIAINKTFLPANIFYDQNSKS